MNIVVRNNISRKLKNSASEIGYYSYTNRWLKLGMKKKLLYIIAFLLISNSLFAQFKKEQIIGSWFKTTTEMKDGSELIPVYKDYVKHFEMIFEKKQFFIDYYPAQHYKNATFNYKLKGNKIVTSKHYAYVIEKLTKDSLVISEQMKGLDNDKLKRHYLIKKEIILEEQQKKNKDSINLIANPFYTPKFYDNIQLYLNNKMMKRHINLNLKGKLKLYPKRQKVKSEITYRDSEVITMQEKIIVDALNYSFTLWDINGFENYNSIAIDFVIIMERKGENSYGIRIGLLTNSFTQLLGLYGLTYTQITDGNKYLKMGIQSYQKNEFKQAIEYFTKSYNTNHTLVESLYNRAFCYYQLKEYDKACIDWKILEILGQKRAIKLFNENCIIKN